MKPTTRMSGLTAAVCMAAAAFVCSCADDGFSEETWQSSVRNSTLASPAIGAESITTVTGADGSDYVQVSWAVVPGAGGYECKVYNVENPQQPVEVMTDTIDGSSFKFKKAEDTYFNVCVRSLGNARFGNTDAAAPSEYKLSTFVPAATVPDGTELSAYIAANLKDSKDEQAFELVAGGHYTLDAEADMRHNLVTLRGPKGGFATVTLGENGVIRTALGLKLKHLRFDCTATKQKGIVEGSTKSWGAAKSPKKSAYVMEKVILMQDCWFRNVPMCLFFTGQCAWGVSDVRLDDCLVQLDNDGTAFKDAAVICTYSSTSEYEGGASWNALVRDITIKNSTIWNIQKNSNNRMIRFTSNKPSKVFASDDGSCTITDCTISKVMSNKEFANNTPNINTYAITFRGVVCYDVFRLQKFIQGNNVSCPGYDVDPSKNTTWGVTNPVDNTDKTRCATEEDPGFGEILTPLDLNANNGGVNFHATGKISSTIGDPRWR